MEHKPLTKFHYNTDGLKGTEWLQVKYRLHIPSVIKRSVYSLEVLELANCHHKGVTSFQTLGLFRRHNVMLALCSETFNIFTTETPDFLRGHSVVS
jgi:hypothetical protein